MGQTKDKPVEQRIKELLEEYFFPRTLKAGTPYFRTHDDCDGDMNEGIGVEIDRYGDAWVSVKNRPMHSCRFRMPMIGGGASPRVRNALVILAEAIRLDNEDHKMGIG